jgi:Arc/MetJ-type ribon-helix-helix transcriptional regulator
VRKVDSGHNDSGPRTEYGIVRVPRVILDRVESLYASKGYTSVSEYIRVAILKQLAQDEAVP